MNHGRGDLAGRHPGRDTVGARGQVDRPPLAHPVRDGQRLEPSHRPSAVPRRSLDRRLPLEGCRQGSTCAGRLRSERSRARGGWRFHVERRAVRFLLQPRLKLRVKVETDWSRPPSTSTAGTPGRRCGYSRAVLAAAPFGSVLTGDASLSIRPMERVAGPLRTMGASVETTDGHAPVRVEGRPLHGASVRARGAERTGQGRDLARGARRRGDDRGRRARRHPGPHRAGARGLGSPHRTTDGEVQVQRFQHEGFSGQVPGDPSSAAFLIAAAALTGSALTVTGVGLNPSRLHFLEVMARMGIVTRHAVERTEIGEPVGTIEVEACAGVGAVRVERRRASPGDRRGARARRARDPRSSGFLVPGGGGAPRQRRATDSVRSPGASATWGARPPTRGLTS